MMDFLMLGSLLGVAWQRNQRPLDTSSDALTAIRGSLVDWGKLERKATAVAAR